MEIKDKSTRRGTKIVCTLGPTTSSPGKIRELLLAGMDVARLNFSHGDHETHRRVIRSLRKISKELGREVGILQDLGGPKIRVGKLPVPEIRLEAEQKVHLSPVESSDPSIIPVNYPYLIEDVAVGDQILVADGLVELTVEEKKKDKILCRVMAGGLVQSNKGVNLPSTQLRITAITEKDKKDLELGLEENVDFVALSFVRNEQDLEPVLHILDAQEVRPMLIAKIEKPQAIERFQQILDKVDGIMVARGDLGVEMPLEEVPVIQKRIIQEVRQCAKPVITATQMLRSMISSPRPTRAEATDVANAVLDGTDALMLSDETAVGEYPVEAVRILDKIARATEPYADHQNYLMETRPSILPETEAAISRAACLMAKDLDVAAIVAVTSSGSTARLVSRFRPKSPIVGLTPHLHTQRRLSLSWGVIPAAISPFHETDRAFSLARIWAIENDIVKIGDTLIVTAGIPPGVTGTTNLLRVIDLMDEKE